MAFGRYLRAALTLQTKVEVPADVDCILVAPKGSGRTVRTLFLEGRGINSSIAVYQDVTGKAKEKAVALGIAVGSGYCYETTFEKEVFSDLYGERGVVSRAIACIWPKLTPSSWVVSRECSSLNTRSSERTATPRPRLSTKPSRRLPSPCSPLSASTVWTTCTPHALPPLVEVL